MDDTLHYCHTNHQRYVLSYTPVYSSHNDKQMYKNYDVHKYYIHKLRLRDRLVHKVVLQKGYMDACYFLFHLQFPNSR